MDCRNFKDLLDSYLCEELAVETNHQILRHAEHCPPCRSEMSSRRNLREALRRACSHDRMSDEACERLRSRLRAEVSVNQEMDIQPISNWHERLANFIIVRFALPATITVLLTLSIVGVLSFRKSLNELNNPSGTSNSSSEAPLLSEALLTEAVDDHRKCAPHFIPAVGPTELPESVKEIDLAYLGLAKVAAVGAKDLQLHSAHICRSGERRFAHLVYMRGERLISLLVTKRDGRALKNGERPPVNTDSASMQEAVRKEFALGAYQTTSYVVVVVSDLPKTENEKLTQALAMPVVEHLRRFDNKSAINLPKAHLQNLIASLRGEGLK